ncbi:MAG TPA: hypothetical protein VMY41_07065 [Thermohalobaculum sp.]|nr:hypothetical protein [Thermohalobaculum sp.]
MQLRSLWQVHGPNGRFDDDGNFVPTEKFGVAASIFMNVVVLPIVVVYFVFLLSLELIPRDIKILFQKSPRRRAHH